MITDSSQDTLENVDQDALKNIDDNVRQEMEAPGAPPIIGLVNIENPDKALSSLVDYLSGNSDNLTIAFRNYLYASCWSIATILRREYGTGKNYGYNAIYPLLEDALCIQFPPNGIARDVLRESFKLLCQRMGIPQPDHNNYISIYHAQAGVAENMLEHLALAFLRQEKHFGLPSENSSQELNQWEDDALTFLPPGVRSPRFSVELDETGWHATLYTKIRRNGEISPEKYFEKVFFNAIKAQLGKVSSRFATTIILRPRLCWNDVSLGLYVPHLDRRLKFWPELNEPNNYLMLRDREVWRLAEPWPTKMRWQNGEHQGDITFLSNSNAIAIFDQQSGRLICEASPQNKPGPLNVVETILLCRQSFNVDGETSHKLGDKSHVANIILGAQPKHVTVNGESFDLALQPRRRIMATGGVIAKGDGKTLYGPEVQFHIETGQNVTENRILRILTTNRKVDILLDFDDTGTQSITLPEILSALTDTDASSLSNPLRLRMELLGLGNIGSPFFAEFWVWPNVTVDNNGFLLRAPHPPTNLSLEHCQYIEQDKQGQICLNRDGGYAQARLAFEIDKVIERFSLPYPDVICVRCTANGQKHFLPHYSQVVLREEERFDTITIRCPDDKADLLVRGKVEKNPFFKGASRNIALRDLMQTSGDARVLIRKNNGVDIELFHVIEALKPTHFSLKKLFQNELQLTLETLERIDAFQVSLEDELGEVIRAEVALKHRPVDERPVEWLTGEVPPKNSQQVRLQITPRKLPKRLSEGLRFAKILVRPEGQEMWKQLGNPRGDIYALLFGDTEAFGSDSSDKKRFQTLSRWMAHCYAPETWKNIEDCLCPRWQEIGKRLFATSEGRSTVLIEAMTTPPENAAPSWVPIAHPLTFLPELYSAHWQYFEGFAVCENEDIRPLSVVAEVSSGLVQDKDTLHNNAVFAGFSNLREAHTTGKPLQGFEPKRFLENIEYDYNYINDDPAAVWFWRDKPFLGPGHWRAAHRRFDERIETIGLFRGQNPNEQTQNAKRQTSLLKLMSRFKRAEFQPPVPKIANKDPNELNCLVAATLCAFAKEARVGCVTDWATHISQELGCSREHVLQDIAFLLRLAPELFAFYMGMWQLTKREPERLSATGSINE